MNKNVTIVTTLALELWYRIEMVWEEGVHVAQVGYVVVLEEDQLALTLVLLRLVNQLSGMGSVVGSTKEKVDVVEVGVPPKFVWNK